MNNGNEQSFLKPEEKEAQKFYQRSLWLIEHRELFKKIGLGIFITFDAILVLFAGWQFLDAYAISYDAEQKNVAVMAVVGQSDLRGFSDFAAAKPLTVSEATALPAGDGKSYDFYTSLSNSNTDWYAVFKYVFVTKDGETAEQTGFILPKSQKPIIFLEATQAQPATVNLSLRDVSWYRVDTHEISDYDVWFADRLGFVIENSAFAKLDPSLPATLSFTVKNTTAFSYWQPSFTAVLWRGNDVGAVMRLTTSGLASGEIKNLSARWLGLAPTITKIEIKKQNKVRRAKLYFLRDYNKKMKEVKIA